MRVAMVVAGAGSMYCGACARDADLARALRAAGHEVLLFPIYTPIRLEESLGFTQQPLRIGGISAYLRDKYPAFRRLPGGITRLLDHPALLKLASSMATQTKATDLGDLTLSFLKGDSGPHRDAIHQLCADVERVKPETILLANSLLAGLIEPLVKISGAPVVCQLQGEDGFLDELPEPWRGKAETLLREGVRHAKRLMAPCRAYAHEMSGRLGVPRDQISVVPPSIHIHRPPTGPSRNRSKRIGHLSSVRFAKGLDLLVDAMAEVADPSVQICIRGKVLEPEFFAKVKARVEQLNLDVEFGGEATPAEKPVFLSEADFIVLPTRLNESRGIAALESLVCGTPVVAPARGIFPELAERTGGVALYSRDEELADTLRDCLHHRDSWCERGVLAAALVAEQYSPARSAAAAENCLRGVLDRA